MMANTSTITATVGNARFAAEGPTEVVLAQYTKFLKGVKESLAAMAETGPVPPGVWLMRLFVTVGAQTTPPATQTPGSWLLHRFVTRSC
jgi:hypothetical protein